MQRNTPLDYVEFLLTRTRTRCELHICANGIQEKLASGYFKPFVAHLRAAEEQFAKGNQVIRLDRPSNLLKKNKVTWFTKGTLERFVRFVTTPEVLERIKNIEDELSQLENVRIALSKTFLQSEVSVQAVDTANSSSGVFQARGGGLSVTRQKPLSADTDDNKADTSKIELLRAMDVRLVALKQEQKVAFSRAEAAGFDSSNMADLLDFSEHFGAGRLRDACIQFISLFRTRTRALEVMEGSESTLVDGASSGSDMSLESRTDSEPMGERQLDGSFYGDTAWPKAFKNGVEKSTGLEQNPGMNEEKEFSPDCTSARTRSRWGPPERIQINYIEPELPSLQGCDVLMKTGHVKHQNESYTHQDDYIQSENEVTPVRQAGKDFHPIMFRDKPISLLKKSPFHETLGSTSSSPTAKNHPNDGINRENMFYSRLQKMAEQVEARRSNEDIGVHFTSVEMSDESPGSQMWAFGSSPSRFGSALKSLESISSTMLPDGGFSQPRFGESMVVPGHLPTGKAPMLQEHFAATSLCRGNPSSLAMSDCGVEDKVEKREEDVAKLKDIHEFEKSTYGLEKREEDVAKPKETNEFDKNTDGLEKSVSTSVRRLSVQAAISLFEGKRASMGEPPTRTSSRQDSKKGAAQTIQRQDSLKGPADSGCVTSEKSVLRRWSAVGSTSMKDMQDTAPNLREKGPGKVVGTESAKLKQETMLGNRAPQVATEERHVTQSSQVFQKPSPLDTSVAPSAPAALDSPSKHRPPAPAPAPAPTQQQTFVQASVLLSVEELQKQLKKELEQSLVRKAQNRAGVDKFLSAKTAGVDQPLPSTSLAGSSRTSDVTLTKHSDIEKRDTESMIVGSMGSKLNRHVGNQEKQKTIPDMLGKSGNALKHSDSKKDKEGDASLETLQPCSLKLGSDEISESSFPIGNLRKGEKSRSLVLHDTPVDLYMQALVMMIDKQHQSSLILIDDDSQIQQTGRYYEHYVRLRSARQRNEHPAKRAEKEAKLRSMKETLNRREAELEAGCLRQLRKDNNLVKEHRYKTHKSGLLIIQRKEIH